MKLVISIDINETSEETCIATARRILWDSLVAYKKELANVKCALTRDGDRSGGNLLLPKLEGRVGDHYQGRKATIAEVLNIGVE